jgi:hypothetical protein
MDEKEQDPPARERLAALGDAQTDKRRADEPEDEGRGQFDPTTGGPGLTGLTPPD